MKLRCSLYWRFNFTRHIDALRRCQSGLRRSWLVFIWSCRSIIFSNLIKESSHRRRVHQLGSHSRPLGVSSWFGLVVARYEVAILCDVNGSGANVRRGHTTRHESVWYGAILTHAAFFEFMAKRLLERLLCRLRLYLSPPRQPDYVKVKFGDHDNYWHCCQGKYLVLG